MFAMFQRRLARPNIGLPDINSAVRFFMRWLSYPGRRTAPQSLQPLESVALTAQASVALVRFGNETLVLGVTPHTVTVLAKGAAPSGAAAAWPVECRSLKEEQRLS